MQVSALEGQGISETWSALRRFHDALRTSGQIKKLREEQLRSWFWNEMQAVMAEEISGDPAFARQAAAIETDVVAGRHLPNGAARALIQHFRAS
jgi:putative protein kinase ArgK-like GTPase of G3E family